MRKADLIPAIKELITGYDNHSNSHTLTTCPLCRISCGCQDCINVVFSSNRSITPCYQRCQAYDNLNYYDKDRQYKSTTKDYYLSLFWQEVLILINNDEEIDIDQLKPEILAIAEKYR